jgi:IclR family transcriptional regulator, pca regulon regulatory protein
MKQAAKRKSAEHPAAGPTASARPNDSYVQSFARGLSVIRAFGPRHREMTLSQAAERTGLTRAGARRILLTLQSLGYVTCDERSFALTPKTLDLGYSYLSSMKLWDFAEPVMEELVEQVHESCSVSVLDGTEIVYVLRVPTRKIMAINLSIGSRLPAFCTSMGRVLLGGLEEKELDAVLRKSKLRELTRRTVTDAERLKKTILADCKKGWSLVNQELEEGLCSLAVPIIDYNGKIIAAMNIGGNVTRTPESDLVKNVLPQLRAAAEKINASLRLRRS